MHMEVDVDIPDIPPTTPNLTRTGRPRRNYRLPGRFRDFLPEPASPSEREEEMGGIQRAVHVARDSLVTVADSFGMWRDYPRRPTRDPDESLSLHDLAENPIQTNLPAVPSLPHPPDQPYWPFANATIHRVMQWLNNGNTNKSEPQLDELVHKVILAPDFAPDHLAGFDAHRENSRLDNSLAKSPYHQQFTETSVDILVPSGAADIPPRTFSVPGLLHRKLTTLISDAFNSHFGSSFPLFAIQIVP